MDLSVSLLDPVSGLPWNGERLREEGAQAPFFRECIGRMGQSLIGSASGGKGEVCTAEHTPVAQDAVQTGVGLGVMNEFV